MTLIINELLQTGLIRPNTSPFSSHVLLVQKKDGTWRFCADYKALNAIIIKDRFPIPTIDELLEELGGVTIFLRLTYALAIIKFVFIPLTYTQLFALGMVIMSS
uniref:Transposon Ty3-I Gag-Pol polyprotein n=1 Tax=Cajanus cajan TaxID=3821 RepID=A0A151S543_CAJCA|nr:Transposon Ty3-I Gag-Pol polyprotein [Cajanus cajan]